MEGEVYGVTHAPLVTLVEGVPGSWEVLAELVKAETREAKSGGKRREATRKEVASEVRERDVRI